MGLLTFALNVTLDGCCDHRAAIADDELPHALFRARAARADRRVPSHRPRGHRGPRADLVSGPAARAAPRARLDIGRRNLGPLAQEITMLPGGAGARQRGP